MQPLETVLALFQDPAFLHQPGVARRQTPVLTQALRVLSVDEARHVARMLLSQREEREEDADHLLGLVHAAIPGTLTPFHTELIERRIFYPGWLYLGAEASTTEHLLSMINEPDLSEYWYHLLGCLAWIGDEQVQTQFQTWRTEPTPWLAADGWALEAYPPYAGWELTPEGRRRDLYASSAFELDLAAVGATRQGSLPLAIGTAHEECCPWCQRSLSTLMELDLNDPRCALVVAAGKRLRVALCDWCSAYVPIFTDADLDGASHWSKENGEPPDILHKVGYEGEIDVWPEQRLVLGAARRTPFETLDRYLLGIEGISQLGGCPSWVQYPAYPRCPGCSRRMPCIGQISWEDIDQYAEGITYVFLCLSCQKAATCYQQT